MTDRSRSISVGTDAPPATDVSPHGSAGRWVEVWDLPTRAPEWWMGVHVSAGYGLVALMAFRIVWSIFRPEYSRVVSFIYPPRETLEHLKGLLLLRPPHHVGHNPTGALMVFALAAVLIALVVTGLLVLGGEEKQEPLAAVVGYSMGSAAKPAHLWLTMLLVGMVALHILAGALAAAYTPKLTQRTALLGKLKGIFRRYDSEPMGRVIAEINPTLRGWVNYFRIGNSGRCFAYVMNWVEKKVRRGLPALRRRASRGGGAWPRPVRRLRGALRGVTDAGRGGGPGPDLRGRAAGQGPIDHVPYHPRRLGCQNRYDRWRRYPSFRASRAEASLLR